MAPPLNIDSYDSLTLRDATVIDQDTIINVLHLADQRIETFLLSAINHEKIFREEQGIPARLLIPVRLCLPPLERWSAYSNAANKMNNHIMVLQHL